MHRLVCVVTCLGLPGWALSGSSPRVELADDYVGSEACRSCHAENHASWWSSFHRTMTQPATPEAVRGGFEVGEVVARGFTYRLERREDDFWVEMPDLSGGPERRWHRIHLVTGSHHMQIYWYPTGRGRELAQLPIIYLFEARRWIPRSAAFLVPPTVRVTNEEGRWNEVCLRCHTTNGRPRLNEGTDTQVSEFGISCEACHGPGAGHVARHRSSLKRFGAAPAGKDRVVVPPKLGAERGSQVCGQCHSINLFYGRQDEARFRAAGYPYRPGDDLDETRFVVRVHPESEKVPLYEKVKQHPTFLPERYWPDGQSRLSGREFNGLIDSPCHERGSGERQLACFSCHQLHPKDTEAQDLREWADDQLAAGMDGDAACVGCHPAQAGQGPAHTRHAPNSEGSRCQNCHMPYTSYGILKAIRSHRIGSPSVKESREAGRPNACNLCHLDRSLDWTGDHLSRWYGQPPVEPATDEPVSAAVGWLLTGDAGHRALLAWAAGWGPAHEASGREWLAPFLAPLLDDPYAAVRYIAGRSLRRLPGYGDFEYDFLADAEGRESSVEAALLLWASRKDERAADGFERSSVLMSEEGVLDVDALDALLSIRDDRPVLLAE